MLVYLAGSLLIVLIAVIQTNLVVFIEIAGARPDLALIFTIYLANRNGPMIGQLSGFVSGLAQDILSISPLGFFTLANTILGMLFGLTRGNVDLDPIVAPVVLVLAATMVKGLLFGAISALFGVGGPVSAVWSTQFLIEIAYNVLLTPLLFGLFGRFKSLQLDWRTRAY